MKVDLSKGSVADMFYTINMIQKKRFASIAFLLSLATMLGACDSSDSVVDEPSPELVESNAQIEALIMASMQRISSDQQTTAESQSADELEKLSESDRQALIALTSSGADEQILEDAELRLNGKVIVP